MRVVLLAAGAGGMLCGSCLRDNRLAATLRAQGRPAVLIPLYTPLRTDEPSAAAPDVLFGGVNVWLAEQGGWRARLGRGLRPLLAAPWLLKLLTRSTGNPDPSGLGPLTLSVLRGTHGPQRSEVERLIEALKPLAPDIVHLPNLMFLGLAEPLRAALRTRLVCTLSGEDLFLDALASPEKQECFEMIRGLAPRIDAFAAVTEYYARHARDHFGLPAERVFATPSGIDVEAFARPFACADATRERQFTLAYLARVAPEKGLHALIDGLSRVSVADRARLRLEIAGYRDRRGQRYLAEQLARAARLDVATRDHGELDLPGKRTFLHAADVLCVPTPLPEAKALYLLEALAAGVPVVAPDHGAAAELVAVTGGGLLYPAGDAGALAERLTALLNDGALARRLAESGARVVRERYTSEKMADATWALYKSLHEKPTDEARA